MTSNDLKRGHVILYDSTPCMVIEVASQSPSARGGSTLIKIKYRRLTTGQVLEKTFKAGERVEEANFEKCKGQFLYAHENRAVFMDLETFEQYELGEELYSPIKGYLLEGTEVIMGIFEGQVVSVEPPMTVELVIVETAPVIKHATAQAQSKEALLETGLKVLVPPYLESGEKVKIDTRDGRFVSRV